MICLHGTVEDWFPMVPGRTQFSGAGMLLQFQSLTAPYQANQFLIHPYNIVTYVLSLGRQFSWLSSEFCSGSPYILPACLSQGLRIQILCCTTFRFWVAFGISGLNFLRRLWTFPANQPTSSLEQARPNHGVVLGVSLPQPTKASVLCPPSSGRFAFIYITKGEHQNDSSLDKESLFHGLVCVYLSREGNSFLAFPNICVWLSVNKISASLTLFLSFVFGQS